MAKYGDLIRKARETENQEGSEPDDQISVKPDNQSNEQLIVISKESKPDDQISVKPNEQQSKVISRENKSDDQISVKPDNQSDEQLIVINKESKPDNQISVKPDDQTNQQPDKEVNLCVKVPKSLRRHWAAEAKRHGITMTEVMTEALIQRFGKPDNQ